MKLIFLSVLFFALNSLAQHFECVPTAPLTTGAEHLYQVKGRLLVHGNIENTILSMTDQTGAGESLLVRAKEAIAPAANFHPKKDILKGFEKFVLEKNEKDIFLFFIPAKITTTEFPAFVKASFEGTFPDLAALNCKF